MEYLVVIFLAYLLIEFLCCLASALESFYGFLFRPFVFKFGPVLVREQLETPLDLSTLREGQAVNSGGIKAMKRKGQPMLLFYPGRGALAKGALYQDGAATIVEIRAAVSRVISEVVRAIFCVLIGGGVAYRSADTRFQLLGLLCLSICPIAIYRYIRDAKRDIPKAKTSIDDVKALATSTNSSFNPHASLLRTEFICYALGIIVWPIVPFLIFM